MVSLEISLIGFSFSVTVYCFRSVSGDLSLEEIARVFFVFFLVFIGDGGGVICCAVKILFFCFFFFVVGESRTGVIWGTSLTVDVSVCLVLFF